MSSAVAACCDARDAGSGAALRPVKRVGFKVAAACGSSNKWLRHERIDLAAGEQAVGAKYSVFDNMYAMPGR